MSLQRNGVHELEGRCNARLRGKRAGKFCTHFPMKGKRRCRMHGGEHGSGAPMGKRNGNYRHGYYTYKAIAERRALTALIRNDLYQVPLIRTHVPIGVIRWT